MSFNKEQFLLDRILQLTQRGAELTAQRDAALAELAALKKRLNEAVLSGGGSFGPCYTLAGEIDRVVAERDALAAQLAALKKRLADAPTSFVCADGQTLFHFPENTGAFGKYALVRLEEDA